MSRNYLRIQPNQPCGRFLRQGGCFGIGGAIVGSCFEIFEKCLFEDRPVQLLKVGIIKRVYFVGVLRPNGEESRRIRERSRGSSKRFGNEDGAKRFTLRCAEDYVWGNGKMIEMPLRHAG